MPPSTKATRKRPAPSQTGPKAKKAHFDAPVVDKGKKRSRPVTAPLKDESTSSSEDEDEEELHGFDQGNDDEGIEVKGEEETAAAPTKDPNASRESHKAQKTLHEQRRAAKPHSDLLVEAKRAWTLARQKNSTKADREKHIKALMDVIRGKVKDIVFKHDASRIVQTVVKHGGPKEREEVAMELSGRYKELAQNKYSKFLVTKLIRLCPNQRASILREFHGHTIRMLLHREASGVLADAFELYANAYERALLLRDFYGKEASLATVTAGSDAEKEKTRKGLKGILEGVEVERKRRIMNSLKDNIVNIFNNSEKGAIAHVIVHRALWEYLDAINGLEDEAEREKLRREIFESCQDVLAEMVHTKDGSRAVRELIAWGTAKDRKQIVKAIKPHVERMCKDDEAQLVLFTALDVIDDTKLTAKSLISDITASASTLYSTPQGRRSLIYLVEPRTRRHFTPAQIATLAETDPARAKTSKKDAVLRMTEVRRAASEELLAWVQKSGAEVSRDPGGSLIIIEIMLSAEGDKTAASKTLLEALNAPYPESDPSSPHPISLPHTSRIYKTLLQGGHYSQATKAVVRSPLFSASAFASQFIELVGGKQAVSIARGEGAFVIAALCERVAEEGTADEKATVKGWFTEEVREELVKTTGRGRGVLLEKIAALG